MNTVPTSLSDSFQWKTFWKVVKKSAITFFMVEDVWDYSCRALIKGYPCPPAPPFIRRPWWGVCGCSWRTVACRHSLVCTHTDFPLYAGHVAGFRSSISQLCWAIWSQSVTQRSSSVVKTNDCQCFWPCQQTKTSPYRQRRWRLSRNKQ